MTKTIQATYQGGVLRPAEPLPIAEGSTVELTVHAADPSLRPPATPLKNALAEIAALPVEGLNDGFSGADHDKVLYGGTDAR
jgi:predicted DNA-binding antitoxin AbrB/MazE fold protein